MKTRKFPSPTGVNYYELNTVNTNKTAKSFRPQQGLTIMNQKMLKFIVRRRLFCFRPQQGLTIMNLGGYYYGKYFRISFRPQQGLTIMNYNND